MRITVTSRPIYVGQKKDILKIANATVFAECPDLGGNVIVPVSLLKIQRQPFVAVGQPTYKNKSDQKRISTLTVHLDSASADKVAEIVTMDFLKEESKRLIGTDKASEHEFRDGKWEHIGDKIIGAEDMTPEDNDWIGKVVGFAKEALSKAVTANADQAQQTAIAAASDDVQKKLKELSEGQG